MFGIGEKLKNAAAAGGAMAVAIVFAMLGLVWLSIAAFTALKLAVTPVAAMGIVGGVACMPLVVMVLRRRAATPARDHRDPEPEPEAVHEDVTAIVRLAHSASLLAEKSPIAGVALTLGAAFLASRSPATTPLAVHMLAETVERWARAAPSSPAPEERKD